ncbi:amidohydrolase family protein [Geminicoccaceae bacterium 1502E]|nr:amidohydrolase family protein [Geminicoccaceae bacterium 1502E]
MSRLVEQGAAGARGGLDDGAEAGRAGSFPWLTAGLVDLQVNGYAGIDFNDAGITGDRLDVALEAMLADGVTTCLPTVITAEAGILEERMTALDRAVAQSRLGPVMVPGYHLEGPFLNPADGYAGCHPPEAMHAASVPQVAALCRRLARPILLLTLAPERPGALELARWAAGEGMVVAMGHTAAMHADVTAAAEAGVRLSTHLGNGLPHQLHKLDNPLMAQLAEDRLFASFIADGIHLPPFALKAMIRAKGLDRSVLVTDAVSAAAAPAGLYDFAGMAIERGAEGAVRKPGHGYLAGSALQMADALRNVVRWGIADRRGALRMASANPRRLLAPGLARHGIALPPSAVAWDEDLHILWSEAGHFRWQA